MKRKCRTCERLIPVSREGFLIRHRERFLGFIPGPLCGSSCRDMRPVRTVRTLYYVGNLRLETLSCGHERREEVKGLGPFEYETRCGECVPVQW